MERNIRKFKPSAPVLPTAKRVAAYARVSSGKDAMLHSLSAQISYYSELIQHHPGWEYVGVYADEAVTGTKDDRAGFQRLISDCRNGDVDMVITKSISRFARNTVTMLEVVRELKVLGVDVLFEKENIHSISEDGELMLTILASYAQEESRSVSENCKWRIRHQFQDGELANLRFMYGYHITKGKIEIDPEEAAIVRMIFDDYLGGMGCGLISKKLRAMDIPTMRGGQWSPKRVVDILKNEKYAGNALLQKKFVKDHLTKSLVRNKGQLPKYYAMNTHEAIIDEATFTRAQEIMAASRAKNAAKTSTTGRYPFSGMIRCGKCGKSYKRKTCNGKVSWNCSTYLQFGRNACLTKQIPEDTIISMTTRVLGLAEFDETTFRTRIAEMIVYEPNKVVYVSRDGHTIEAAWQDRSRSESWTDAKKQQARERTLRQRRCGK